MISDSSVLIDLAKAKLIESTLALPYEFVIPDVIFADELIDPHHLSVLVRLSCNRLTKTTRR